MVQQHLFCNYGRSSSCSLRPCRLNDCGLLPSTHVAVQFFRKFNRLQRSFNRDTFPMQFLGWKESIYSFGHESDISIRYLNGLYHIWNDQVHLEFNEHLQEWNVRKNSSKDPDILNKLKQRFYARIQRYRNDLRSNTLHP